VRLTVGNKVVYPRQGPCLIGAVVERIFDGRPVSFYRLIVLNDGGGEMFVPVDNVLTVGIRPLLRKADIPKLLDRLTQSAQASDNRKQRSRENLKLLATGSAFDLAEVVESLTELRETKTLSFGEHKVLDRARALLVYEISEVFEETKEEAEQQVDMALKARTLRAKADLITDRISINACNRDSDHRETENRRNKNAQQAVAQSS
jgi:CarD family transcriptional regulator